MYYIVVITSVCIAALSQNQRRLHLMEGIEEQKGGNQL